MELPERDEWAERFGKAFAKMTDRHRARLRELMGEPPDPRRVDDSFWREVEQEAQATVAAALYLLFLDSADYHAEYGAVVLPPEIDDAARRWSEARATDRAARYAQGARDAWGRELLGGAGETPPGASQEPLGGLTPDDLEDALLEVFGPKRAGEMAETETTKAQTAGGEAAVAATVRLNVFDTWSVHPELTRSGPCERCLALAGRYRKEWAAIDAEAANGPPIHDYCACTVEYAELRPPRF